MTESRIVDYEDIVDRMRIALLPEDSERLSHGNIVTFPLKSFHGIVAVIVVDISGLDLGISDVKDSDTAVLYVTRNLADRWEVNDDELFISAMMVTRRLTKIKSFSEVLRDLGIPVGDDVLPGQRVMLVSSTRQHLGAGSILTAMPKLRKMFPGGFTVLPSSIHEVIVVEGYGGGNEFFSNMVHTVNNSSVAKDDRLSDMAYQF